jgi:hypothetical protein
LQNISVTAPLAARRWPHAKSDNVTAAIEEVFSATLVLIIFACFHCGGAFFATGENDICVYAGGAK